MTGSTHFPVGAVIVDIAVGSRVEETNQNVLIVYKPFMFSSPPNH